jgi:hypothetical protein
MRFLFLHSLTVAWAERIAWFWPIWLTETAAVALGTAWIVDGAPMQEPAARAESRTAKHAWTPGTFVGVALLALLWIGYVAGTLKWEVFTNYDDAYYTLNIIKGSSFPPPIWRDSGRFFPLSNQEFNLVRHFTHSVAGYHGLPLIELAIFIGVLLMLDGELSLAARVGFTASVLVLPGTVISFTGMTFPERNVLFCLACLMLFLSRFEKSLSPSWAVAAVLAAQVMVYYKETAFLLIWGFAAARLIFRCRRWDGMGWNFGRLRDKESRLDFCLISVGALFLIYYAAAMLPHPSIGYVDQQRFPLAEALACYLKADLLAWVLAAVALPRAYLILRGRVEPALAWDALAVGGVAYFAAYLCLGLVTSYYLAPVDFIAVLYLGRLAVLSWDDMRAWSRAAVAGIAVVALVQGASISVFREFERKNTIHAKAEIGDLIVTSYHSNGGRLRVYFPFTQAYPLTEFAAYLAYRGVPIEEQSSGDPAGVHPIQLLKEEVAKDGLCLAYRGFIYRGASRPAAGDLVVEMPDDDESADEMSRYRDGGRLLWSYEPDPKPPHWLYKLVSHLRAVPVHSRYAQLSAGWLQASVVEWK